jgi:outer membrane receptor protein involved in Fe transport
VNLRATYRIDTIQITGYVNNVFNEKYRQALLAYPAIGDNPGQNIGYPAPPRMYGIKVAWNLN